MYVDHRDTVIWFELDALTDGHILLGKSHIFSSFYDSME